MLGIFCNDRLFECLDGVFVTFIIGVTLTPPAVVGRRKRGVAQDPGREEEEIMYGEEDEPWVMRARRDAESKMTAKTFNIFKVMRLRRDTGTNSTAKSGRQADTGG